MSKTLFIGAIASIIAINSVFADTTVTTQSYVDTRVETKQDKISAGGADAPISVITDTDTNGVVAKRFIIEGLDNGGGEGIFAENVLLGDYLANAQLSTMMSAEGNNSDISTNDMKKSVVSVGVLESAFDQIQTELNYMQPKKRCVQYLAGAAETSENCLLWNLPDD